jgi:ArsR family metal-binding transcriptional regulator
VETITISKMGRIPANDSYLDSRVGVGEIVPRSIIKLDDKFADAMAKMRRIYTLSQLLPQVDCGICGSPTCKSLAEDVVQTSADLRRCIFIQRIHEQNEWLESPESVEIMREIWGEKKLDKNSMKESANEYNK